MATAVELDYTDDLEEIFMKRNDTFEQPIGPCEDPDGDLWDFDNVFVSARAQAKDGSGVVAMEFSTNDNTMDISVLGFITLHRAKVDTDITPGSYPIDFEFRTADNEDKTLYKAVIVVADDITK